MEEEGGAVDETNRGTERGIDELGGHEVVHSHEEALQLKFKIQK